MATIQAKILTVKDKVFIHNNRRETPQCYMSSKYDKDFIYTESKLFQTYNSFEMLKAFTHKKNNDFIEQNPYGSDGKKRRKLKNNVELLTEVLINFDKEIFEKIDDPKKIHQEAERLAIEFFTKELGFQVLSVATHLDEHHKDDKTKRNYHTHITLLNYNFSTHKTVKRTLSKKHLIKIQDIVSKKYKKYGFSKTDDEKEELSLTLSEDNTKTEKLQNDILQRNNLIKSLQEKLLSQAKEIEILKNQPKDELSYNKEDHIKLEKKNEALTTLIKMILQELNVSQEEISNMNFHAIDDMKKIIYKKLDMLKLYEFLNVGFAPTQEEVDLNTLEENFQKSTKNRPNTTINLTTDEF